MEGLINSFYSAVKQQIQVITPGKPYIVFNCRWFTVYALNPESDPLDRIEWIVWKWNHLFKSLEPEVLAQLYHYYPVNFDVFKADIHARGVFVGNHA